TRKVRVYERIPVEIIAPGGGETWKGTKEIRWNASFRKPVSIDIWYSPNRGKKWVVIAQNTENDGVFAWDTKTVADGYDYSIKIEAYAEDAYGEAKSNLFTISNRGTEKSWKGFHANAGFALSTTPNAPDLLWTSPNIGAVPSSSLIIANGKIYVLCTDGRKGWVTCLDEDTGNTEWKSNPRGEWGEMSWATPAYYNGKIYVPMRGTITVWVQHQDSMVANPYSVGAVALHEIDAASGDANVYYYPGGTKETVNAVNGGALAAYDTVFFNTYNNRTYYKVGSEHKFTGEDIVSLAKVNKGGNYLFRLQDDTGRPIAVEDWDRGGGYDWAFRVDEAYAMSTPGAGYGNIYVGGGNMGFNSGKLYCVNEATGKRNWKRSYPASVFCSPTVVGGNVYITTYGSSATISGVYAVDAMNGERVWDHRWKMGERPSDSTPAYAPFDDGYVYVAGGGGRTLKDTFVACLDATNGNLKWDVHTKVDKKGLLHYIGYWTNSPVVSIDRKVFVGEPVGGSMSFEYQGLWCLGALTGKEIWHTEYGGSTVAIANGRVYTSGGGRVFAYGPEHLPDLIVESIETPEDHDHGRKIYAGVPTPINVTIKNIGEGDANGTFSLSLQYGEGEIDDKEVDSLKKGEVKTVEFWWTPPVVSQPRNYTLQAEVNANKGVNEADLTNNRKSTEVTVYPQPPDIELVKIDAPSRAEVGESCSIRVEVRNNGADAKNISVILEVEELGEELGSWLIPSLERNETWTNETSWTPQSPGNYTLRAVADPDNDIEEYNETNNEKETYILVKMKLSTPPIKPGWGPRAGGGGTDGVFGGGTGTGTGTGNESGTGGKMVINETGSIVETVKNVIGHPFGTGGAAGGGGGGGSLYLYLLLLLLVIISLFYLGYYKERRSHRRNRDKK
ncbi:MAG: PQQ-binding-like beta-propeller repeat protein, partial [Methanophagales archaeon]|nr:PQQ-binding-like beta-propeller repeat protein [Methanophagales archaeon]